MDNKEEYAEYVKKKVEKRDCIHQVYKPYHVTFRSNNQSQEFQRHKKTNHYEENNVVKLDKSIDLCEDGGMRIKLWQRGEKIKMLTPV